MIDRLFEPRDTVLSEYDGYVHPDNFDIEPEVADDIPVAVRPDRYKAELGDVHNPHVVDPAKIGQTVLTGKGYFKYAPEHRTERTDGE